LCECERLGGATSTSDHPSNVSFDWNFTTSYEEKRCPLPARLVRSAGSDGDDNASGLTSEKKCSPLVLPGALGSLFTFDLPCMMI